jgi:hypothetical protein
MNIQPPPSSFRMDKRSTFLEKSTEEAWKEVWRQRRRWASARGQAADDPAHPGSRRTGTRRCAVIGFARVLVRWQQRGRRHRALERGQAAVEWTQCRRRGSSTGSSRIPTRGQAAARRSVQAKEQRSGWGACLKFASTSVWQQWRGVEERRRRCRGPHLWLWQRPRWRRGKFLWISLPFYLFYRWSLR